MRGDDGLEELVGSAFRVEVFCDDGEVGKGAEQGVVLAFLRRLELVLPVLQV